MKTALLIMLLGIVCGIWFYEPEVVKPVKFYQWHYEPMSLEPDSIWTTDIGKVVPDMSDSLYVRAIAADTIGGVE